jgi:hypothetical protein
VKILFPMGIFIRLLDSTGSNLIDSIAGDYEDSFTLDTFEAKVNEFIEASTEHQEKHFIIARVETRDPKQPGKGRIILTIGILFLLRCLSTQ